jgi:hypothetical protein
MSTLVPLRNYLIVVEGTVVACCEGGWMGVLMEMELVGVMNQKQPEKKPTTGRYG